MSAVNYANVFGVSIAAEKQAFVFKDQHFADYDYRVTTCHEIGHVWSILNQFPHIDAESDPLLPQNKNAQRKNYLNGDYCIMSYDSNDADEQTEFCVDCLTHLRSKQQL